MLTGRAGAHGLFRDLADAAPARFDAVAPASEAAVADRAGAVLRSAPAADLIEVFDRARNPEDPLELRDLYLGRLETQVGHLASADRAAAERWSGRPALRRSTADQVLSSRATVRFVKELYNSYFRDQLYGRLRSDDHLILSSGSPDETLYGLPRTLLECLRHSLDRGWYGYSDSRGRAPSREAIAELENAGLSGRHYSAASVAITLGGTFGVSSLADFILGQRPPGGEPALCALPNYPPMVESVARRGPVTLVPLAAGPTATSLRPLIDVLRPATPLVLLQTVTNPTGTPVDEKELEELIVRASPATMVVLDEAHECIGAPVDRTPARSRPNVVRVASTSKTLATPGMKLGWILADPAVIAEFYEYASSTYGGPPSLFYLLIEVMARMERWLLEGVEEPGPAELAEFEPEYGLEARELVHAYRLYARDRAARDTSIQGQRAFAAGRLATAGADVVQPAYSVNLALRPPGCRGGFRWFREALEGTRVSVFPGILTLDLSDSWVRVTVARDAALLREAVAALGAFIGTAPASAAGRVRVEGAI